MKFDPANAPTKQPQSAFQDFALAQLKVSTQLHDIARAIERAGEKPGFAAQERLFKLLEGLEHDGQWEEVLRQVALLLTARERLAEVEELKEAAGAHLTEDTRASGRALLEEARCLANSYFGPGSPQVLDIEARLDFLDGKLTAAGGAAAASGRPDAPKACEREKLLLRNLRESLDKFRKQQFETGLAQISATALCAAHWLPLESETRQLIVLFERDMQSLSTIRRFLNRPES